MNMLPECTLANYYKQQALVRRLELGLVNLIINLGSEYLVMLFDVAVTKLR